MATWYKEIENNHYFSEHAIEDSYVQDSKLHAYLNTGEYCIAYVTPVAFPSFIVSEKNRA